MNVTNKVARLRIDIPTIDWEVGDLLCVKCIYGDEGEKVADVEHIELGNTLTNLSVHFIEMQDDAAPVPHKLPHHNPNM